MLFFVIFIPIGRKVCFQPKLITPLFEHYLTYLLCLLIFADEHDTDNSSIDSEDFDIGTVSTKTALIMENIQVHRLAFPVIF